MSKEDYGKLDSSVYYKLSLMTGNERLRVTLHFAKSNRASAERESLACEQLAQKYPKVQQALSIGSISFNLRDPQLKQQIILEFEQLVWGDLSQARQQITNALQQMGVGYTLAPQDIYTPSITPNSHASKSCKSRNSMRLSLSPTSPMPPLHR